MRERSRLSAAGRRPAARAAAGGPSCPRRARRSTRSRPSRRAPRRRRAPGTGRARCHGSGGAPDRRARRKYRSKTRSCSSGGTPRPRSRTLMTTPSSWGRALIAIWPPSGQYLMALLRTCSSAWRTRSGSQRGGGTAGGMSIRKRWVVVIARAWSTACCKTSWTSTSTTSSVSVDASKRAASTRSLTCIETWRAFRRITSRPCTSVESVAGPAPAPQRLDGVGRDRLERRPQRLAQVGREIVLDALGGADVGDVHPDDHLPEDRAVARRGPASPASGDRSARRPQAELAARLDAEVGGPARRCRRGRAGPRTVLARRVSISASVSPIPSPFRPIMSRAVSLTRIARPSPPKMKQAGASRVQHQLDPLERLLRARAGSAPVRAPCWPGAPARRRGARPGRPGGVRSLVQPTQIAPTARAPRNGAATIERRPSRRAIWASTPFPACRRSVSSVRSGSSTVSPARIAAPANPSPTRAGRRASSVASSRPCRPSRWRIAARRSRRCPRRPGRRRTSRRDPARSDRPGRRAPRRRRRAAISASVTETTARDRARAAAAG